MQARQQALIHYYTEYARQADRVYVTLQERWQIKINKNTHPPSTNQSNDPTAPTQKVKVNSHTHRLYIYIIFLQYCTKRGRVVVPAKTEIGLVCIYGQLPWRHHTLQHEHMRQAITDKTSRHTDTISHFVSSYRERGWFSVHGLYVVSQSTWFWSHLKKKNKTVQRKKKKDIMCDANSFRNKPKPGRSRQAAN